MYETVCEGITLYYTIFDAYRIEHEKLPKGRKHKAYQMSIEDLLFKVRYLVPLAGCKLTAESMRLPLATASRSPKPGSGVRSMPHSF